MANSKWDMGAALPISALTLDDSPGLTLKAAAGLITGWAILNTTAAVAYVQVFEAAAVTDVTLGTTTAKFVIPLAANGVYHVGLPDPIRMATGITVFATTTATGSTGAAVNGVFFIG